MITYNIGTKIPSHGMYACRVRYNGALIDYFLSWDGKNWLTVTGDICRDQVMGWIGPLQRNPPRRNGMR